MGYFPASWIDGQGRIAPPGPRTPRAEVLGRGPPPVAKKLNFWSTGTRKSPRKDRRGKVITERSATSMRNADPNQHPPKDWLRIFPQCLPTRTGFKDAIRTTAQASSPNMDYRRKSVRHARGKQFEGATDANIVRLS